VKLDKPKPKKNADVTSKFWEQAYSMKLSPEDGNRILEENDGDFAAALAAISKS